MATDNEFKSPSTELMAEVLRELVKERRSEKRWKNFRFFMGFLSFFVFIFILYTSLGGITQDIGDGPYVALIKLSGMIDADRDFSAEVVLPKLRAAFADKAAKGVVLDIDSGGGSPVQSSIIHDAIIEFKQQYHKQVLVVGEDLLASGAYYVAVAADKIYVNPNSITGSIGVIMKGFGFDDTIKKLGIERRVFASGNSKDRLDPFLPTNPQDVAKIQQILSEVHLNFSQVVLEGRKGKLHGDPKILFSGDFWSGQEALKLGLVDGLGNVSAAIKKEFHVTHYHDYSAGQNLLKNIINQVGVSFSTAVEQGTKLWAAI